MLADVRGEASKYGQRAAKSAADAAIFGGVGDANGPVCRAGVAELPAAPARRAWAHGERTIRAGAAGVLSGLCLRLHRKIKLSVISSGELARNPAYHGGHGCAELG